MLIHYIIFTIYAGFLLVFAITKTSERIGNYESRSKWLYEKAKQAEDKDLDFYKRMYEDSKGGRRQFQISYGFIFAFYCYASYMILGEVIL